MGFVVCCNGDVSSMMVWLLTADEPRCGWIPLAFTSGRGKGRGMVTLYYAGDLKTSQSQVNVMASFGIDMIEVVGWWFDVLLLNMRRMPVAKVLSR